MSFIFQEIPAESLHNNIQIITGDNSVLMSAGNRKLFCSSVASCRYVSGLTFKPIAVCFLRPKRNIIRFIEKNECFTLSYFSPKYQYILDSFGSSTGNEKIAPGITSMGNIYYTQAEWVFECRKVFDSEFIQSNEMQNILVSEKKLPIYPGNETPQMFVGEIICGWYKVLDTFAKDKGNTGKLSTEPIRSIFRTSGEK